MRPETAIIANHASVAVIARLAVTGPVGFFFDRLGEPEEERRGIVLSVVGVGGRFGGSAWVEQGAGWRYYTVVRGAVCAWRWNGTLCPAGGLPYSY